MKRIADRSKKYLAVICFFVFTVFLYGPFSIYLTNREEFWFTPSMLLMIVLPVTLIVFLLLFVLSFILPETKGHIVIKLFFGIALALYIQGNYLNISYGSGVLDGTEIVWSDYMSYAIWDTAAWIVCLAIPFIIDVVIKKQPALFYKILTIVSAFLIAVQVPAFVSQAISSQSAEDKEFKVTTRGMFELSSNENIIVFVLDTMDEAYYQQYLEDHPEFTEGLTGFIHFDNAATAGSKTILGIPAMFTGSVFRRESSYSEYLHKVWSKPNVFSVFHDAGYKVYVYSGSMEYSADAAAYIENFDVGGDTIGSYPLLGEKAYRMVMFKHMPHLLKQYFVYDSSDFEELKADEQSETETIEPYKMNDPVFFSKYAESGFVIKDDVPKMVKVYHLNGAHSPYTMNEKGEKVSKAKRKQQVAGSFNQVGKMLEELKEKGIYDSSTILIMADHGEKHVGENPIFLLKEKGATGACYTSNAPVSYFDLPPYLASLAGRELDSEYSEDLLSVKENTKRERHVFYNTSGNSRIVVNEYVSTEHAGDLDNWKLANQFEEKDSYLIEYELGTKLSFGVDATGNRYAFEGFGNNTGWRTKLYGPLVELRIPIKQLPSEGELTATIGFYNQKADYNKVFSVEANGITVYEGKTEKKMMKNGFKVQIPVHSFGDSNILNLKIHFPDVDENEMEADVKDRTYTVSLTSMTIEELQPTGDIGEGK